jgi:hypothetical protein
MGGFFTLLRSSSGLGQASRQGFSKNVPKRTPASRAGFSIRSADFARNIRCDFRSFWRVRHMLAVDEGLGLCEQRRLPVK